MQSSPSKQANSFSAAQRIPRGVGYGQCLKSKSISDEYFKLFFANNHLKKARLGIVVAKKYFSRSVDRNKAKRKIRESFRIHRIRECGVDVVVMARKVEHPDPELYKIQLDRLLSKVAILCAQS